MDKPSQTEGAAKRSSQSHPESSAKEDNIKRLGELIRGIRVAMMTTVDRSGALLSRPMATQEKDFDGRLWFFTRDHSGKVASIENDQHVNLAYVSEDDNRFISVSGRAEIVHDKEKMKELWNPMLKAWFPNGVDDPEIALISVDVESAGYWDAPSGAFVMLAGFAKATLTGKPYDGSKHSGHLEM